MPYQNTYQGYKKLLNLIGAIIPGRGGFSRKTPFPVRWGNNTRFFENPQAGFAAVGFMGEKSNFCSLVGPKSASFINLNEVVFHVPVFAIAGAAGQHGYLESQRYPKPGDPNPLAKMGVVEVATGKTVWADYDANADHYFGTPFWTPDSKALWMQWKNRGQDNLKLVAIDPSGGSVGVKLYGIPGSRKPE